MRDDIVLHVHIHQSKYGYMVVVDKDGELTAESMDSLPKAFKFLEATVEKNL